MPKLNLDQEFCLPIIQGKSDAYFDNVDLARAMQREKLVSDILDGQLEPVAAVVAFNPAENWSKDITVEIAELARATAHRDIHKHPVSESAVEFIAAHTSLTESEELELTWKNEIAPRESTASIRKHYEERL